MLAVRVGGIRDASKIRIVNMNWKIVSFSHEVSNWSFDLLADYHSLSINLTSDNSNIGLTVEFFFKHDILER